MTVIELVIDLVPALIVVFLFLLALTRQFGLEPAVIRWLRLDEIVKSARWILAHVALPIATAFATRVSKTMKFVRWTVALLAVPLALAFVVHFGVNRVAQRPDPHGSAVVAMAVSNDGAILASHDLKGDLRFIGRTSGPLDDPSSTMLPRRLGAIHPVGTSVFAAVDMRGGVWVFEPAPDGRVSLTGVPGDDSEQRPGTYLTSSISAEGILAVALARAPIQQQQQQQQVPPAGPDYVVKYQQRTLTIGELTLPARPTVLAPYVAGPNAANFPSNSSFQPYLIGFADGTVGIITVQDRVLRLGSSLPDPSETARYPIHLLTSSKDGDIASVDTAGRVKFWQFDQKGQRLAAKEMPPAFLELKWRSGSDPKGADRIYDAGFSPDSRRVVTGSEDGRVRIWDAATGRLLTTFEGHVGRALAAAYSKDGARIVTGGEDGSARIWDVATGRLIVMLQGHNKAVYEVAFSPDGTKVVTASEDETALIWDAATGLVLTTLSGHGGGLPDAEFSPDGAHIVTASSDGISRIWDVATGRLLLTLDVDEGIDASQKAVNDVAYSPDGAYLATVSTDNAVLIWDAVTGAQIGILEGHRGGISTAAFSPDGTQIATASFDGTVRIWDAASRRSLVTLEAVETEANLADFSPDGARIATLFNNYTTAWIWRRDHIDLNSCLDCAGAWFNDGGSILSLATGDERIIDVDPESGLITNERKAPTDIAFVLADIQGRALAANKADGEIEWLDGDSGASAALGVHADQVSAAVKLPGGRVALGFLDGTVEIVDPHRHGMVAVADIWPETRELTLSAISWMQGLWAPETRIEDLDSVIGTTTTPLDSRRATVRAGEAAIGNLVADALREAVNADVAITNGGSLRGNKEYPAGHALTRRDVLTELPFGNRTMKLEATGATILSALENGLSKIEDAAGRFPQVSGLKVEYDEANPEGSRVVLAEVNGRPLDVNAKYTIATNDFMVNGGDGYMAFKGAKPLTTAGDANLVASDVLFYIRARKRISPVIEGRIVRKELPTGK